MWVFLVIVAWVIYFLITREDTDGNERMIIWRRFDGEEEELSHAASCMCAECQDDRYFGWK
jgi:hypothetical protein